ncbi:hypothetical protein BKA65DRAFT_583703, partial [Rhexocercosporidium sp. MPI-PUGE-AT-0058]
VKFLWASETVSPATGLLQLRYASFLLHSYIFRTSQTNEHPIKMSPKSILYSLRSSSVYTGYKKRKHQRYSPSMHPTDKIVRNPNSCSTSTSTSSSSPSDRSLPCNKFYQLQDPGYPPPPPTPPPSSNSCSSTLQRRGRLSSALDANTRFRNQREPEHIDWEHDEALMVYEHDLVDGVVPDAERGQNLKYQQRVNAELSLTF